MRQRKPCLLLAVLLFATCSYALPQALDSAASPNSDAAPSVSCAPPAYGCARSDLITTHNLNPPPDVSKGKNALVTPSDFNLPIVRITDGTLYENRTFTETPGGSNGDNIFNTTDTYMMVIDTGGWRYPVSFNPSTMQVGNASVWNIGTNQQRWTGSSSFSRVNANEVFAVMGETSISGVTPNKTTLMKVTLSGTASIVAAAEPVFDFGKCPGMPSPYDVGRGVWRSTLTVSAGDKRFSQAFSNRGGQNTGGDVVVYDAPSRQCYRYDTLHARLCTANACVPMSLPDEFTVHQVYMSLNGEYLRIVYRNCLKGGCTQGTGASPYYWQIGTTNVVRCYSPSGPTKCIGHQVEGYSHFYNSIGWPETEKRPFSDPFSYSLLNPTPTLTPMTDHHYSNNAADADDTNPIWVTNVQNIHTEFHGAGCRKSGNIYEGCTFPGPLYGEVFGIKQDGSYIRTAHTYNSGSSSNFNCSETIGAVSQSGKFFAWSSDWLTTLGKDSTKINRCDVFVVNLAAQQGAKN
jgi:hypothetical protein